MRTHAALLYTLSSLLWIAPHAATLAESPNVDLGGREVRLGDNPILGDPEAPVTVVEFLDFECAFCARHLGEILPLLEAEYIETGKVRYVELDFPLTKIHRDAMTAARAGHCAGEQGRYWELRDRMLTTGANLSSWDEHIAALELEGERFQACLAGPESAKAVRADMLEGTRVRVPGTPTLVIAMSDPEDATRAKGLTLLAGSKPWETVKTEIDRALAELPTSAAEPMIGESSTHE